MDFTIGELVEVAIPDSFMDGIRGRIDYVDVLSDGLAFAIRDKDGMLWGGLRDSQLRPVKPGRPRGDA